jgi:hypothetical protein
LRNSRRSQLTARSLKTGGQQSEGRKRKKGNETNRQEKIERQEIEKAGGREELF